MSPDNLKGTALHPCICPTPIENGLESTVTALTYLTTWWQQLKRRWRRLREILLLPQRSRPGAKRLPLNRTSKL